MKVENVIYLNINYTCNNKCKFCFSINTHKNGKESLKIEQIRKLGTIYSLSNKDRIIINGGEPLLYKNLNEVIRYFKKFGCEVVLYTNGRLLSNCELVEEIVDSGVDRITIPIHGVEKQHDLLTQVKGSYKDTVQGIKNLIQKRKNNNKVKIELKFIIFEENIVSDFSILNFLISNINIKEIDMIIFSGLVRTKVFDYTDMKMPEPKMVSEYVSKQVEEILKNKFDTTCIIRFEDIRLCMLHENLLARIKEDYCKFMDIDYKNFYYVDSKYNNGKLDLYNEETTFYSKCRTCELNQMCGSILDRYRVLNRSIDGKWFVSLE